MPPRSTIATALDFTYSTLHITTSSSDGRYAYLTWALPSFSMDYDCRWDCVDLHMEAYPNKKNTSAMELSELYQHAAADNLCSGARDDTNKSGAVGTGTREVRQRVSETEATCGRHGIDPCGIERRQTEIRGRVRNDPWRPAFQTWTFQNFGSAQQRERTGTASS